MNTEFFIAIALEVAFIRWVIQQPSYGYDTTREGFWQANTMSSHWRAGQ